MSSYVLDNLEKYHCFTCDKEFILSEYQRENATEEIICPYCHSKNVEDYVFMDDEDGLNDLGCMGISHYTDPKEEFECWARTWGVIEEMRKKKGGNKALK
ncbi:hypothetical protein [Sporanaerobacter acetigenes]|uniref:Uncharacterized protein n=1 Tax=Sporanaerobacter acetigenes DSM 13106 TaxID=1123281 RepID=A0A1M5U5H1_9FIRM|nr:hypothetical protein [Sporanaerobacter acetigenes]SHH58188.1 hypothetical protein SAMN02745180_00531 [Sporanaerobacter acetigenes DSM 13106]